MVATPIFFPLTIPLSRIACSTFSITTNVLSKIQQICFIKWKWTTLWTKCGVGIYGSSNNQVWVFENKKFKNHLGLIILFLEI
jgi:ABC-type branched-subunit amino acid transport system permease subunit